MLFWSYLPVFYPQSTAAGILWIPLQVCSPPQKGYISFQFFEEPIFVRLFPYQRPSLGRNSKDLICQSRGYQFSRYSWGASQSKCLVMYMIKHLYMLALAAHAIHQYNSQGRLVLVRVPWEDLFILYLGVVSLGKIHTSKSMSDMADGLAPSNPLLVRLPYTGLEPGGSSFLITSQGHCITGHI